ncbi:hypothetical protein PIB30_030987 [Stylosanthes scabra]|uniref:RRM domain-containing protein n=1 Tax=Stylosanthes scabra TaxID=79078 RepID=A0ABU6UCS1_9FABA|nr:hypothetical protein [Stylosanthes scabra]
MSDRGRNTVRSLARLADEIRGRVLGGLYQVYGRRRNGGHDVRRRSITNADGHWTRMEKKTHTVFVDNLPKRVTNGSLFRYFGRMGGVVDIYISWKQRQGNKGGAIHAIDKINGVIWGGKRLLVKTADYGRTEEDRRMFVRDRRMYVSNHERLVIWEKKHGTNQHLHEGRGKKDEGDNAIGATKVRRCVEVMSLVEQKELLDRSVLVESFQPIKFGNLVVSLENHWEEYGKIEVRDLGPRKCILTFASVSARDAALANGVLLDYVDEARVY